MTRVDRDSITIVPITADIVKTVPLKVVFLVIEPADKRSKFYGKRFIVPCSRDKLFKPYNNVLFGFGNRYIFKELWDTDFKFLPHVYAKPADREDNNYLYDLTDYIGHVTLTCDNRLAFEDPSPQYIYNLENSAISVEYTQKLYCYIFRGFEFHKLEGYKEGEEL